MWTRRQIMLSAVCATAAPATLSAPSASAPSRTLTPYAGEAELRQALKRWQDGAQRSRRRFADQAKSLDSSTALESAAPPQAAPAALAKADSSDAITNVQTAGVDEGGIVKRCGDHLVILRRGRLFSVRVGGDALRPVAVVDAYAPGSDPRGAWYDELLISGDTVVVIGYSYARGGTEIGLFELDHHGGLAYRRTYHLRSFDYYSSRNYASRLIGSKLVFYTPTYLSPWQPQPWEQFPAFRHWQGETTAAGFERILPATRTYRSDDDFDPGEALALHTVTSCDLAADRLQCESSAVLGPAGRVFYVSQGSVYVWTSAWRRHPPSRTLPERIEPRSLSAAFRLPLDGTAPTALKTAGVPIDQMSFLEDATHLNVLLRESGQGEAMWGSSERLRGAMALMRVPLNAFTDGRDAARAEHYRALPAIDGGPVQNRFVGDWLLWGSEGSAGAWALRFADAAAPLLLQPGHAIERIEAMGGDAVLVGNAGVDLHFSAVRLVRSDAHLEGVHVQAGAAQGETRSHGFFYKPQGDNDGLLGLPVLSNPGMRRSGIYAGAHGAASVLFLRCCSGLRFIALGSLHAGRAEADDTCKASCVDWYGNARPIFAGERIFALLGYEIVEGRVTSEQAAQRIAERRRISFAPAASRRESRYSPFK